jgi:thermostable 8-oxoguanine DNA glycosylase
MIDPSNITNYNLNHHQLEEHIIFWILVAGKTAKTISPRLEMVLEHIDKKPYKPFQAIRNYKGNFANLLKKFGIGCFNLKAFGIKQLANSNLNLHTCTVDDLEKIKGVGNKTSRCFIVHSRQNAPYACLDTHVLRYLRNQGYDVPKGTPTGKKYREIEQIVLRLAQEAKMTPAAFDLMIWNNYSLSGTKAGVNYGLERITSEPLPL